MATNVKERSYKRLEAALALLGFAPINDVMTDSKFWIADPLMYSQNPDVEVKMVLCTHLVKPTLDIYEFAMTTSMNGKVLPQERQIKKLIMTTQDWVEHMFPQQMILLEMHDFFELKSKHTSRWDDPSLEVRSSS